MANNKKIYVDCIYWQWHLFRLHIFIKSDLVIQLEYYYPINESNSLIIHFNLFIER